MEANREQTFLTLWHEGKSYAEIGTVLGIPERTVKSHASKLRREGKIKLRPSGGRSLGEMVHRFPHTVHRAFVSDVVELQLETASSNQEGLPGGPSMSR